MASKYVAVQKQPDHGGTINGGVLIEIPRAHASIEDWCAYYGARIENEVVVLYKAVSGDYKSAHGFLYMPGTQPEAPDWDGGKNECGGGLHFCAHPVACLEFDGQATRFLACPVAVEDIRPSREGDAYPHKLKARRICGPIVEVDRFGDPIVK